LASERSVTDCVDAAVQHVQAAGPDAAVDGIEREPERAKLASSHDAVLLVRERCDEGIDVTRSGLTAHIAVDLDRVSHGSIVPGSV
jgi:hypothetical protein